MVVGSVGGGKSALVKLLLGELRAGRGAVLLGGSVAFAAQRAWIFSATVRDNIVLNEAFEPRRYWATLAACSLLPDVLLWRDGDLEVVGERGRTLSGGQRQRISVARAVYARRDVYVFDDPLSAVDVEVAEHIFAHVFEGLLRGKTVLLVANQLQFLPRADRVLVMDAGEVREQGTYRELCANGLDFARLMQTHQIGDKEEDAKGEGESRAEDGAARRVEEKERADAKKDLLAQAQAKSARVEAIRQYKPSRWEKLPWIGSAIAARGGVPLLANDENAALRREFMLAQSVQTGGTEASVQKKTGTVGLRVWLSYLWRGMGLWYAVCCVVFAALYWIFRLSRDIWLGVWIDDSAEPLDKWHYLGVYAVFPLLEITFGALFMYGFVGGMLRASKRLHRKLLWRVVRAPMSFFHTTPVGQVLNRFSKDMDQVDSQIGVQLMFLLNSALTVLAILIVAGVGSYGIALVPAAILFVTYLVLTYIFRRSSVELQRLEAATRSPIFAMFGEAISGVQTIRAFGLTRAFAHDLRRLVNNNARAFYYLQAANMWLSIRLDWLGSIMLFCVALIAVGLRGVISAGSIGIAIVYSMQLMFSLNALFRFFSETEIIMVSIERIKGYSKLPQEPPLSASRARRAGAFGKGKGKLILERLKREGEEEEEKEEDEDAFEEEKEEKEFEEEIDDDDDDDESFYSKLTTFPILSLILPRIEQRIKHHPMLIKAPPLGWPSSGTISFRSVHMRYRPELPQVLKDLTFDIRGGEKIGIVGRTGSGKSSALQALFRLVELDSGSILLDGVDISRLGLHDLRPHLAVIPQEPTIFVGTIRSNLDPFKEYSSDQVWDALERCRLAAQVREMPGGLNAAVQEGGAPFSVGQQQLLCLCRAMLTRARVLVVDEATASVDYETDRLIQLSIREHFCDSTVLTVAHRLNTIMDCDRVLVMDNGAVGEFDAPHRLLQNESSHFRRMVRGTGEKSAAHLTQMALDHFLENESESLSSSSSSSSDDDKKK